MVEGSPLGSVEAGVRGSQGGNVYNPGGGGESDAGAWEQRESIQYSVFGVFILTANQP